MLVIRDEQIEIFEEILGFEYRMIRHLQQYFSLPSEMLGEGQIRKIIQYGAARAEDYGFPGSREKCVYISSMMLLGSDFDRDIQLSWAVQYLKDWTIKDSFKRSQKFYDIVLAYLEKVAGPKNEHFIRALVKIRDLNIRSLPESIAKNFDSSIYNLLTDIYPEKSKDQGKQVMDELIRRGRLSAREYGLTSYKNVCVYIGMMFILGSGFDDDFQFPWAYKVLNDKSLADQDAKAERLYKLAMKLLNRTLARTNS